MISELATVSMLHDAITKKLGSGYLVNTNFLTSSLTGGGKEPDLVIWGPDKNRPFIVEFKSLKKGVGVPLVTVPMLVSLVDANPGVQPHLIFATNGHVGPLVRNELETRDIDIVESQDLADLTSKITNVILMKSTLQQS